MEGDYEKNRQKKWGWRVSGITLIQNSTREKKYPPVKILSIPLVKKTKNSSRENLWNSARENPGLPEIMFKKVGVKINFHPWKKSEKSKKGLSRAFLIFTGEKKHCPQPPGLLPTGNTEKT